MAEGGQDQNSGVADALPTSFSPGTSDEKQREKKSWWKKIRRNLGKVFKRSSASSANHQEGSATLAEGENVHQNFIKSKVNAVAGDEIHGNKVIKNYYMNDESQANPADQKINYGKLIQICNDNTKELTAVDILEDFRLEKLQQPDFEVYPQMQQGDMYHYYKGHYGRNQLIQEVGFLGGDRIGVGNIRIGDVVKSMWQKEKLDPSKTVGITAIVASAGSGKSTLTRRIARQALGVTMDQVQDQPFFDKRMVHYIELKNIEVEAKIRPSKFLFGGLYENEFEEDQAFKWLDKNQTDAVLIFDGLDQARWNFDEKTLREIKKHEKASSWTVMYNILSRNILRHVKVYIASREFKISELPAMARPETIITLNGLTMEDANKLFTFLLGEEGESLWQKIETMSPRLLNLVSVPVFLILTAVVMGRDPSKPPPRTVTELYNRIISALQSVENIRNREQILSIVNKLKALAFQGMKKGKVVFKETDLKLFKVSPEEVQDLMTKVPGNNLLSRHLMQGDFTFFFCHQSIQEYLAAIFVTEMEFNEFSRFDEEHLHEERWSVVRRFVAGVVFSKSQNDLYKVSAQTMKREVLVRSILSQLKIMESKNSEESGTESYVVLSFFHIPPPPCLPHWHQHERLELYTTIYESDDDDLMKQLDVIDVCHCPLSRDQAHVIGMLVARSQGLEELRVSGHSFDDETFHVIGRCIKEPVHVKLVDLRCSKISARAVRSFLAHPRIETLSGNLHWKEVWMRGCLETVGDDVITIDRGMGRLNIENANLTFGVDATYGVDDIVWGTEFLVELFGAKTTKIEELLATQENLRKMTKFKLGKISKILLDCTKDDDIDRSLIETSLENYHFDLLDIAVNGHISVDDYNKILECGRAISVFSNIHALFYVVGENDFKQIQEALQQKKIEYVRCILKSGYRASLDEISSLVNESNLKKVTLICNGEDDMLKGDELQKAKKIANDIDTEFESLILGRETDVWRLHDYAFNYRERKRRGQM